MSEGKFLNLSKFPLGPLRLLVLGFVFATYALTIGMTKTGSFSLYNQGAIEKAQSDQDSAGILPENHDSLRPILNATIHHDELNNRGEASKTERNPRKEELGHSKLKSQTQVQVETQEKMETQRIYKSSFLRFDWANLPPQTELGRRIQRVQSQCLQLEDKENSEEKELQGVVAFSPQPSGIGSAIHTWMRGLCYATENNFVLLTRMGRFQWNDQELCPSYMQQQQTQLSTDRLAGIMQDEKNDNNSSSEIVPTMSAFWCYFGHHESGLQCPERTLNLTHIEADKAKWIQYRCPKIMKEFGGLAGMSIGAAEWLFQNVSQLVIQEAERQIHEEAFPTTKRDSNQEKKVDASFIPPSESIVTVHIRWGDKAKEMTLQPIDAYINATLALFTPEERKGETPVYIYVSTEDPTAVEEFQVHARKAFPSQMKWSLCTSGPKNPTTNFKMTNAAQATNGKAGLQSMGALLIALEANRYVLTGRSNWSRLINELRQSVVDSRCGNCTTMLDVTA